MTPRLVGALDQGTSSTRFIAFDTETYRVVASAQAQLPQLTPRPGWVEMDPAEILQSCLHCMKEVAGQLRGESKPDSVDGGAGFGGLPLLEAIGITNQRETAVAWDRLTGQPLYNAIVWLDQRTAALADNLIAAKTPNCSKDYLRDRCGLPIHSYFSALKFRWLIDNVPAVSEAVTAGRCLMGNVDSWLIWNLTGGPKGGIHVTDVTNASRTMLMNLKTLTWDPELCAFFDLNHALLPAIRSSAEIYGAIASDSSIPAFSGIPIAGCAGDQQAALIGHGCFSPGQAKNTYGTGCFLLCNTGAGPEHGLIHSRYGLLTTLAYQLGKDQPACYALEGSVAVAGAGVRYLRDNLAIIQDVAEVGPLADSVYYNAPPSSDHVIVEDINQNQAPKSNDMKAENNSSTKKTGDHEEQDEGEEIYFVPAFSGLFAPHWDARARGLIVGLTQHTTRAHLARALLEAVAWQTADVVDAMCRDGMPRLTELKCDGGMTGNDTLMQMQADALGVTVLRARNAEATAKGAAILATIGAGLRAPPTPGPTSMPPDSARSGGGDGGGSRSSRAGSSTRGAESTNGNGTNNNHSYAASEASFVVLEGSHHHGFGDGFEDFDPFVPRMTPQKRQMAKRGWDRAVARSKGWIRERGEGGAGDDDVVDDDGFADLTSQARHLELRGGSGDGEGGSALAADNRDLASYAESFTSMGLGYKIAFGLSCFAIGGLTGVVIGRKMFH